MGRYTIGLEDTDRTQISRVGGKGAHLGELAKLAEARVPEGFCIATEAFEIILAHAPSIDQLLQRLSLLQAHDRDPIHELGTAIRAAIEAVAIPAELEAAITRHLTELGEHAGYAVRSSATAEDLPTASFAGQQDTYLNVVGKKAILQHVSKCWASLFTDRAVTYRMQHGFDHRSVHMAVVVQKMIVPQAAGILFTADPVTSNREVVSIDAGFGLGEALVSGLVNADRYRVRDGNVIEAIVSSKTLAIYASKDGGTERRAIEPEQQTRRVLTDPQALQLAQLGKSIERHFGQPQDIEWCLADDAFYIVQSRPITTLYPIPAAADQARHVYVSVGHQQMMTDALKPLGLSLRQLAAFRPMFTAGGRQFVDVAAQLASPVGRENLLRAMGQHDPLVRDAIATVVERGFIELATPDLGASAPRGGAPAPEIDADPALVTDWIDDSRASLERLKREIRTKSGAERIDFILKDIDELKRVTFDPRGIAVIMAAMDASTWLNEKMQEWLGETNAADVLSQSVSNNVTSEMGLDLLDVADVIRPYPEVVDYLRRATDDGFLQGLSALRGGAEVRAALESYLDEYGMRCAGEIDITKPRWSEQPTTLVPMILGNIKNFEPNASTRKLEQGRRAAREKERQLLERLAQLPDGAHKVSETKRTIARLRSLVGYREYPKYVIVSRYFVYKQALLQEAEQLVRAGVLHEPEDIYYLTFEELHELVRSGKLDEPLVRARKVEHALHEKLTPPRVMTSEGEIIVGHYQRENLPADALVGLPVSAGVVEGRARVILKMEDADLEKGDILVTAFTDPSWTPLFVAIAGLITEVGGLMTHGAVIAREYGLPAIVGVENATRRIRDGQRIRLHGTEGYVEIL